MIIRIATRRSRLALAQAGWVRERLLELDPTLAVEVCEYVTRGDQVQDVALSRVGGKGLFTREIEQAILEGEADLAVHSLKDLPAEPPEGLRLAAVPVREDPRDCLVCVVSDARTAGGSDARSLIDRLPHHGRIGSSSVRRQAQLRGLRDDLRCDLIRGNVDTRLAKLDEGSYDALILAAAGLNRLGLSHRITAPLPPHLFVPAPGQGALGLQVRAEPDPRSDLIARVNSPEAWLCVSTERTLMRLLGGGCSIPLGAHARLCDGMLELLAMVAGPEGRELIRVERRGDPERSEELAHNVAEELRAAGADRLLQEARAAAERV